MRSLRVIQRAARRLSLFFAFWVVSGCASALPKGQYEMHRLEWQGVEEMSDEALQACLATQPRDAVTLRLGLGAPTCGEPPFDEHAPSLDLWTWPWEPIPVYDPAIFQVDRRRIERWYAARGYYEARVLDVRYRVDDEPIKLPERCDADDCELDVTIVVEEGKPVLISRIELVVVGKLAPALDQELREAVAIAVGRRFDEAAYKADEARMTELLGEASYARAKVSTQIEIDRVARTAAVHYRVEPGPFVRLGTARVEGNGELSAAAVLDVARLKPGTPYSATELREAERAIYDLGVFASVVIEPHYERAPNVADLVIRVSSARLERLRLGIGVMSGSLQRVTSDETESVPEWDVHLRAAYEHRNFLGGMRKLRIEDRPRLIFLAPFPYTNELPPKLGNTLSLELEQPRFPEHRTTTFTTTAWDVGPDAFKGFFRHDVATRLGLRRKFFGDKLAIEVAVQHDLYELIDEAPDADDDGAPDASSYRLPFAEQQVKVDLRNDGQRPSRGAYFSTTVQEALMLGYGSWNYVRWLGEARAYQRLFWKVVLAERFALGAIFIGDHDPELDPTSAQLGPQSYRLRGGGANGNRGFGAGKLGAGIDGGKRRWESSIELRIPLGADLGFALFLDGGDVSRGSAVHFDRPHLATGFGFRYYTPFAPIRFDAGWRIPDWQRFDGVEEDTEVEVLPSAAHLTIGEAF
jgi:outer membrane protein assembly factor BamA